MNSPLGYYPWTRHAHKSNSSKNCEIFRTVASCLLPLTPPSYPELPWSRQPGSSPLKGHKTVFWGHLYWTMSGHNMSFVLTDILHQQSQSIWANLPLWEKLPAKASRPKWFVQPLSRLFYCALQNVTLFTIFSSFLSQLTKLYNSLSSGKLHNLFLTPQISHCTPILLSYMD